MTFEEYVKEKIISASYDEGPFCPVCGAYCDVERQYDECMNCEFSRTEYNNYLEGK